MEMTALRVVDARWNATLIDVVEYKHYECTDNRIKTLFTILIIFLWRISWKFYNIYSISSQQTSKPVLSVIVFNKFCICFIVIQKYTESGDICIFLFINTHTQHKLFASAVET